MTLFQIRTAGWHDSRDGCSTHLQHLGNGFHKVRCQQACAEPTHVPPTSSLTARGPKCMSFAIRQRDIELRSHLGLTVALMALPGPAELTARTCTTSALPRLSPVMVTEVEVVVAQGLGPTLYR